MKGTYLGEFEEVVLLTVAMLEESGYGISVKQEVEKRTNRTINLSAIHATLYRLEKKGFLSSKLGEATKVRGGKRKRIFFITPYGVKNLKEAKSLREGIWNAIPSYVLQQ
ncbi:PadR family transcriptional regulator [Roseivirga misakiensis]|uniref:PadR family transcriptional regulator n=1 Tax=Roseivirga misakiensis TaxID=1563681 RepID=A0A1E5T193_9BACT|nr:PadR family transcriptional regulator [Roseivirga misakiensis]OEK05142.1 PadR family transcriptional regulator [Roseivirga misakiensis]